MAIQVGIEWGGGELSKQSSNNYFINWRKFGPFFVLSKVVTEYNIRMCKETNQSEGRTQKL